jgi:hypothetical protein
MNFDPFRDENLIRQLMKLRIQDEDRFMDLVYTTLESWPSVIVQDSAETGYKITTLRKLREHYESREDYEKCEFLFNMEKKLNHEEG